MNASQLADEIKQMVMAQLFVGKTGDGAIAQYSGRGNLRGWIRIIAVREAARMLRAAKREISEDEELAKQARAAYEKINQQARIAEIDAWIAKPD